MQDSLWDPDRAETGWLQAFHQGVHLWSCVQWRWALAFPREPGSGGGQSSEVTAGWECVERTGMWIPDVLLQMPTNDKNRF